MVSELAQQVRMRDQVFISYSHKDAEWMERFCTQLKAIVQTGRLKTWTDHQIEPGQDWRAEIEAAMARTSVALLLTSADSPASNSFRKKKSPHSSRNIKMTDYFCIGCP
jgi:internalin A